MKIKVKKLYPQSQMPYKKYDSDFCFDVYATSCARIAPNVYRYGTGLAMQIQRGDEDLLIGGNDNYKIRTSVDTNRTPLKFSIDLRPRSSVWKTGMVLSNCQGTIDENYTGEITAIFYHVLPQMPRYQVGDRIGQIKIGTTLPIKFVEVKELNGTDRGQKGYGSTGK